MNGHVLLIGIAVGLLSTVVMDLGGGLGLLLGVTCHNPKRMGHELIGRWVGYLFHGQFKHTDILSSPLLADICPIMVILKPACVGVIVY